MYSCIRQDMYLMTSNSLGVLANGYGSFTALELLAKEQKLDVMRNMEYVLMAGLFTWVIIGYFAAVLSAAISPNGPHLTEHILGSVCSFLSIAYYIAPLSTVREIIRTKNAASLYMPMLLMNLLTSVLWSAYGYFGANDIYLFTSNSFAFVVTTVMILVKLIYPSHLPTEIHKEEDYELTGVVDEETVSRVEKGQQRNDGDATVSHSSSSSSLSRMVYSPMYNPNEETGLRRRGSSVGDFTSKMLQAIDTPRGFSQLPSEEFKDESDSELDSPRVRSRRASSIAELASTVVMGTLEALTFAPLDNRSSLGTMGGRIEFSPIVQQKATPPEFPLAVMDSETSSTTSFPPTKGALLETLHEEFNR